MGDKKKNIGELLDSKEKDTTHVSMPICYFPRRKVFLDGSQIIFYEKFNIIIQFQKVQMPPNIEDIFFAESELGAKGE